MDGNQDDEECQKIAKWGDVSFSCNEETVAGTAGLFLTDCIYHVRTQATINPTCKQDETPAIRAIVKHEELFIAVDNSLHIFNENCCELKSSLTTKAVIDCFAVSEDGNFILLGESKGTINLIYIPLAVTVLSHILVNVENATSCFCGISLSYKKDKGYYDAVICGYDNTIYKISTIYLEDIGNAILQNDLEKASHCRDQIKLSHFRDGAEPDISINSCHFFEDKQNKLSVIIAGGGSTMLKIWAIDDEICTKSVHDDIFDCSCIIKTQMSRNNAHVIILDGKNNLHLLCSSSLILLKTWTEYSVSDFAFWESADSKNLGKEVNYDSKLLTLTAPNDDHSYLNIYNFLSFELIYTTKMSPFVWLVAAPYAQENVIMVEGILEEYSDVPKMKRVENLRIKSVEEMVPETRLSRLLKKRRFDEAESFGNAFGLDLQIVYWTRLNCLAEDLLTEKYQALTTAMLHEIEMDLFCLVDKLGDLNQLVEYCQVIEMPSLDLHKKFLLHVKKKLKVSGGTEAQMTVLNKVLHRLFTFKYIFGSQNFNLKWNEFKHYNIFETFLDLMETKNISVAVCLWLRHEREIIELANIKQLLQVIPNSIHASEHANWFYNNFLSKVIKFKPEYLETFCTWLIKLSKDLESLEKVEWPNNAVQFARNCFQTLNNIVNLADEFSCSQFCAKPSIIQSSLHQLGELVIVLEDLELLHRSYKCQIRYADFVQEDKIAVCCELLNGIHNVENIADFVTEFLKSYLKRLDVDVDYILLQYIKDVLSRMSQSTLCWDDTDAEERINIVIQNISSDEPKCKAVLEFISTAPWCKSMDSLVEQTLNLKHSLVAEIREQVCFVEIKKILRHYDIDNFNLSQGKMSEAVIKYILAQDKSWSLRDALKVSQIFHQHFNAVDVYLFRLKFLIYQDQEEEFRTLIREIPTDYSVQSCERFVHFVCNLLNVNSDCPHLRNLSEERLFIKAALYVLRYLPTHTENFKIDEFLGIQFQLEHIYLLQVEYGIHLSPLDLNQVRDCEDVFTNYVNGLMTGKYNDRNDVKFVGIQITSSSTKISRIYRLGGLLNFSNEKCLGLLTRTLLDNDDALTLTEVLSNFAEDIQCADAFNFFEEIGLTLHQIIQKPSPPATKFTLSLVLSIHKLISVLLVRCEPGLLQKCLIVTQWTSLILQLTEKKKMSNNSYAELFQSEYQELSLVNGIDVTESVLHIIVRSIMPGVDCTEKCDPQITTEGKKVCDILGDKGSLLHSLRTVSDLIAHFNYYRSVQSYEKAELEAFLKCVSFKQDLMSSLLVNVLSSERIDTQLALGLALNLPKQTTLKILTDIVTGAVYDCPDAFITNLGNVLANLWSDLDLSMTFSNWHKHVKWVKKFTELGISTNIVIEMASNNEWKQYMPDIAVHSHTDLKLLEKFCSEFNIKLDDALLLHIEHLIKQLPLKNTRDYHLPKSPNIFVNNMALQPLFYNDFIYCAETVAVDKKIEEAIIMVENKVNLLGKLNDFLNKISPYNYESISVVLHHILRLITIEKPAEVDTIWKKLKLLDFLNDYRRVKQPSEIEFSSEKVESHVCHYRLPFHSFYNGNPWKIISTELNSETAALWQRIAPLLQLRSFDEALSRAVNDEVIQFNQISKKRFLESDFYSRSLGNWQLEKIFSLIDHVMDPMVKMSCAVWVVSNLPMGLDKVTAAKKLADLATMIINNHTTQLVSSSYIQTTKDFIKRCKRQLTSYLEIATEVILLKHGLKTAETEKLIDKPGKLIAYLLEHHVLKTDRYTDIFKISNEIAHLNNINFEDIHVTLVEKWLIPADCSATQNVQKLQECKALEDEKLQRALYILKQLPLDETIYFLLNKIWQEKYLHNYAFKYRVLKCLSLIADDCQIKEYSRNMITDVWEHLRLFRYLSQFEKLKLSMKPAMFQESDKENLAITVWKKTTLNNGVITLVANLCIDYKIKNLSLWEEILEQMTNRKMTREIDIVLFATLDFCEFWEINQYANAWTFVTLNTLQYETASCEDRMLHNLYAVETFFRCPVPFRNYSETVCAELFKIGHSALGIGCVLQMSDFSQSAVILESHSNPTSMRLIRDDLTVFKEKNLLFPQYAQVMEFFLKYVQISGLYDLILDTDFYKDFVLNLIKQNAINKLLMHFNVAEKWRHCTEIIEQFISHYPDSPATVTCQGLKDRILVETFINATTAQS